MSKERGSPSQSSATRRFAMERNDESPGESIMNCNSVYEPREDSTLLELYVRRYAKGSVLDVGTGSGIQAITAAHNSSVDSVIAVDIQKSAIGYCKKCIKNRKIVFLVSDLFSAFKKNQKFKNKKFDAVIFNPPYLPSELKVKDLTIEGGKKGYEVIERFFNDINSFLKADGIVLTVFSSLTKKEKVDGFIQNNLLEFELLEKQHYFFEDLHAYLVKKSDMLKKLENKKIKNVHYFTKGKRGLIYTGDYNDKKIIIKIKNPKSEAVARIENEIKHLKLLNRKGIGPRLLFFGKDFIVYEFIEGDFILDFLRKSDKNSILKAIKNIFEQLFIMDKLKMNKEEMSHPPKHIIINKKNKPVLIDFERSHYTLKPGNITQFCNFLISSNILKILKIKKIKIDGNKIIKLSKKYKNDINKNNLNKIINQIR